MYSEQLAGLCPGRKLRQNNQHRLWEPLILEQENPSCAFRGPINLTSEPLSVIRFHKDFNIACFLLTVPGISSVYCTKNKRHVRRRGFRNYQFISKHVSKCAKNCFLRVSVLFSFLLVICRSPQDFSEGLFI